MAVQDGDYVGIELNIELCHNSVTIDQLESEYNFYDHMLPTPSAQGIMVYCRTVTFDRLVEALQPTSPQSTSKGIFSASFFI